MELETTSSKTERIKMDSVNNYESIYILKSNLTEDDQKSFFRKNKEIIGKFSGSINHVDTWGQRHLGNPIEKVSRGTYFHMTFQATPDCIEELERTMLINDQVLRFFHKKLDGRIPLEKHLEAYRTTIEESKKRAEASKAFKKSSFAGKRGGRDGGGRDRDNRDRERKPASH